MSRLFRDCVITEKIDGTNAQVVITEEETVLAGSRTRWITPEDDNYGFARWVHENSEALIKHLGVGQHFGEWWGGSIQGRYGKTTPIKRLSLFNTTRWANIETDSEGLIKCVPILYEGPFRTSIVDLQVERLRTNGSVAAPGCMNPEGVVTFHAASNKLYKTTLEKDENPKGLM